MGPAEGDREKGSGGLDFGGMLNHARTVGGPALRKLTFHERAHMLKALGQAIMARKEELYELSYNSGATRGDSWIDIEGGAGTLFSFSSKGRRELPNGKVLIDGAMEPLSKGGTFVGQHVYTPLQASGHISTRSTSRLGDAGEARADPARRCSGDREAGSSTGISPSLRCG